jgi:hypothetical protein
MTTASADRCSELIARSALLREASALLLEKSKSSRDEGTALIIEARRLAREAARWLVNLPDLSR